MNQGSYSEYQEDQRKQHESICLKLFVLVENQSQTLVYCVLVSSSCSVNGLFLAWEVRLLHAFILSQVADSHLVWRPPTLSTLQRDRGSFFLLGSCWSLHVHGQACSVLCHAGINIGGKADIPPSIFFSRLWNYFVQVAFHSVFVIYYTTCMVCYWLTVYTGFILNIYTCLFSGCIPSHVGSCDKVLTRLQAAASVEFRGEEVKLNCSRFKWLLLKQTQLD